MQTNNQWIDASVTAPNESQPILVIDSWNMLEDDVDAHKADDGNVIQPYQCLRIAYYSSSREMWWCSISDQRVRFRWYIPLSFELPRELEGYTFQNGDIYPGNMKKMDRI